MGRERDGGRERDRREREIERWGEREREIERRGERKRETGREPSHKHTREHRSSPTRPSFPRMADLTYLFKKKK